MTSPLLSNALSEVRITVDSEHQRTYTIDDRRDGPCKTPQVRTRPSLKC